MPEERSCLGCGKVFFTNPARKKKHCSRVCAPGGRKPGFVSEKRKKKIEKKCITCQKTFSVHPCRKKTAFFCSRKCTNIGRKTSLKDLQIKLKARLIKRKITRKENHFLKVLELLQLNYVFVGCGQLIIDRYCPDFVHKNKKIIIELCDYNKYKKRLKKEAYKKEGYDVLFITNTKNSFQLKTLEKIKKFTDIGGK